MFEEVIMSKRELGQDIRDMETNFHEKLANEPEPTRERANVNVKERFLFERWTFYDLVVARIKHIYCIIQDLYPIH